MRKGAVIIFFLALALVVAGCQSNSSSNGPSITSAFIGGTSSIKLAFIQNSPPSEVTDMPAGQTGFPFQATVTVENLGEYSIPAGKMTVSMSGFFPGDFGITTPSVLTQSYPTSGEFRGVTKDPDGNKISGDIAQITFPTSGEFKYSKVLPGNQQFPFRAEVCYPYKTQALSQVCLMDDLTSKERTICNPTGSKQVSNSGAPVQVTSVTQSVGGRDKVILNFQVKKVGTSQLYKVSADGCKDDFTHQDRVLVTVNTGLSGLNCLGLLGGQAASDTQSYTGEALLSDGTATFTCIQTLSASDRVNSLKTFNVDLAYYSKDSVSTNVVVKHVI